MYHIVCKVLIGAQYYTSCACIYYIYYVFCSFGRMFSTISWFFNYDCETFLSNIWLAVPCKRLHDMCLMLSFSFVNVNLQMGSILPSHKTSTDYVLMGDLTRLMEAFRALQSQVLESKDKLNDNTEGIGFLASDPWLASLLWWPCRAKIWSDECFPPSIPATVIAHGGGSGRSNDHQQS